MNVENIKRVRDHIAGPWGERFDITDPRRCIMGAKAALQSLTREYLYLELSEGYHDLIMPEGFRDFNAGRYGRAEAVAVLDHLIETGEVDWDYAIAKVAADSPASHVAEREG